MAQNSYDKGDQLKQKAKRYCFLLLSAIVQVTCVGSLLRFFHPAWLGSKVGSIPLFVFSNGVYGQIDRAESPSSSGTWVHGRSFFSQKQVFLSLNADRVAFMAKRSEPEEVNPHREMCWVL